MGSDPVFVEDGSQTIELAGARGSVSYEEPGSVQLRARSGEDVTQPTQILIKNVADVCDPRFLITSPSRSDLESLIVSDPESWSANRNVYRETPLSQSDFERASRYAHEALSRVESRGVLVLNAINIVDSIEFSGQTYSLSTMPSQRRISVAYDSDRDRFEEALLAGVGIMMAAGPFAGIFDGSGFKSESYNRWLESNTHGYGNGGLSFEIDDHSARTFGVLTPRGRDSMQSDIGSTFAHLVLNPDRVFHYVSQNDAIAEKVEILTTAFGNAYGMDRVYFDCVKYER